MEMVKKQLNDHNSGVKPLGEQRVVSLKNRLQSYKGQIFDASRTLSEEVIPRSCIAFFYCLRGLSSTSENSPPHLSPLSLKINAHSIFAFVPKEIEEQLAKHSEL